MIKKSITPKHAIDLLNSLLNADPDAANELFHHRVNCNDDLSDHPTIQVSAETKTVSILGVLNGLFGVDKDGGGIISAWYNVVCSSGCEPESCVNLSVYDKCPRCDTQLSLGKLFKFGLVDGK